MNIEKVLKPKEDWKDWKCRAQGGTSLLISAFSEYFGTKYNIPFAQIAGGIFAIDGMGDIITGYHHYVTQKIIEGAGDIINKIKKKKD